MFGWIGVALAALVTGWLAFMLRREKTYRNNLTAPKCKTGAQKKWYHLMPGISHDKETL